MAYRFTNTDKWQQDAWFSELKPNEKLLFIYLCENCDMAGFIEYSKKRFAFDTGIDAAKIDGALKALSRGLIWSLDNCVLYIRNFLKHQKNLPLNPDNNAHSGIIARLENKLLLFGFQSVDDFYSTINLGASEGLASPQGNGKGNGKDNIGGYGGIENPPITFKYKNWKTDFNVYLEYCKDGFSKAYNDDVLIAKINQAHPAIDPKKSIEASYNRYWSLESAWEKKRKTKSIRLNWTETIFKNIDKNAVFK